MEGHVIGLPSTGLFVKEGVLYRQTKKGVVVARHALRDIRAVRVGTALDWFGLTFTVGSTALAVVAQQVITSPSWRWMLFALFVFVAAVCLLAIRKHVLHLELAQGPVAYDVRDPAEEAMGFAASLKSMLTTAGPAGADEAVRGAAAAGEVTPGR